MTPVSPGQQGWQKLGDAVDRVGNMAYSFSGDPSARTPGPPTTQPANTWRSR